MSECEWLSDRMPVVAQGRAEWTPDEIRHLNECGPCQREWELMQLASQLGVEAGLALDPDAIAAGVLRRLAASGRWGGDAAGNGVLQASLPPRRW